MAQTIETNFDLMSFCMEKMDKSKRIHKDLRDRFPVQLNAQSVFNEGKGGTVPFTHASLIIKLGKLINRGETLLVRLHNEAQSHRLIQDFQAWSNHIGTPRFRMTRNQVVTVDTTFSGPNISPDESKPSLPTKVTRSRDKRHDVSSLETFLPFVAGFPCLSGCFSWFWTVFAVIFVWEDKIYFFYPKSGRIGRISYCGYFVVFELILGFLC